jgi:hypothetical protein
MSKKQLLAMLCTAKQVKCTMIGGAALEDWESMCNQAYAKGYILNGPRLEHPDGRYVLKPQFTRIRLGKFGAGSKEYSFTWDSGQPTGLRESFGQVTGLKEVNGALESTMFSGAILRYEVAG